MACSEWLLLAKGVPTEPFFVLSPQLGAEPDKADASPFPWRWAQDFPPHPPGEPRVFGYLHL
ncbi:hypothetical protein [Niveibacterium terrae]|uniref:hypothetical protein n=1 Tax=Niveibacterium terrae TaxID=3373598 RepID=UPI003A91FD83